MVRTLAGLCVILFAFTLIGCGSSVEEIKPTDQSGQKLDTSTQQKMMEESLEKMPPQMREKMKAQMEQMKKMQEGAPK